MRRKLEPRPLAVLLIAGEDGFLGFRQRLDDLRTVIGLSVDVVGDLPDRVNAAGEQASRIARGVAALVDEQSAPYARPIVCPGPVPAADHPSFDELVDLLRIRLRNADALKPSELHSFKELMADQAHMIGEQWYWDAFEELEAQGHLDRASFKANHGDAHARLSADGRLYLRSTSE